MRLALGRPDVPVQDAMELPRIETPCIKVCVIDPASRLCGGCGRTIDEIAAWSTYTREDRRRIMAALPGRLNGSTKA
jgi:predicted Fe-S protein YdhL (DUF1289 family)